MTKQKHPAISVAATADEFRRAGYVFGRVPQTIALAALSAAAYRALSDDPSLVIVPTAVELDETAAKALPYADAPHVVEALATVDALTLAVDDEADRRTAALEQRQAELDALEKALNGLRAELDARERALDEREKRLQANASTKKTGK
ncbi:hypothetical protein [Burkholderia cepacia]|uniref:hypothetical protein n=1 Tax=Burkholderia cepacia TaxID=292 RepID=UPI00075F2DCC|nr:hypothetical protein [Burkholderia cepacia]KWH56306.1 hypothetical protein WM00_13740 [Burkholderia cepacia]